MKKTVKTIGMITMLVVLMACTYLFGTMQTKTITETETVIEYVEVVKPVEVVPDGYIDITSDEFYENYIDMRQVADFASFGDGLQLYFYDGTGYYWER